MNKPLGGYVSNLTRRSGNVMLWVSVSSTQHEVASEVAQSALVAVGVGGGGAFANTSTQNEASCRQGGPGASGGGGSHTLD